MSIFAKLLFAFQFVFIGKVSGISNGCPLLWKSFGESCYLKVHTAVTWPSASYHCKRYGGQLVRIESHNVNIFLTNYLIKNTGSHWIGLHRCGGSKWCFPDWTIASPFSNWNKGEPNNHQGYEGCVEIWGTGYWNDGHCRTKHPYICQKKKAEAENLVDRVAKLEGQALQVYIKSEGCNDVDITGCGHATIMVNGKDYAKKGRGHNIVVVNAQTGIVESSSTFDTYASWTVANKMANFLNTLQKRKLVLIAIQDESSLHMNGNAYNALVKLGAYYPLKKKYRSSYAQIGWTGPGQIDVIAQVQKLQYKGPSIIAKVIPLPL